MSDDAAVISDRFRSPIVVQRRADGSYFLSGPSAKLILSRDEIARLHGFASDSPQLGQLHRFPCG